MLGSPIADTLSGWSITWSATKIRTVLPVSQASQRARQMGVQNNFSKSRLFKSSRPQHNTRVCVVAEAWFRLHGVQVRAKCSISSAFGAEKIPCPFNRRQSQLGLVFAALHNTSVLTMGSFQQGGHFSAGMTALRATTETEVATASNVGAPKFFPFVPQVACLFLLWVFD